MIIITGASGRLGRMIVKNLVQRHKASQIGVSVRDPAAVTELTALGVRVRQGDFAQTDNLAHAFEGATQVLIVSSNARATGGDPLAQHRNAIAAAKAAGAKRIVYTSHMAASATSAFPPMRDHAATEDMLRASGVSYTALRHGFYAASALQMMGNGLQSGNFETPHDGKVCWTAHDDLAEAAASILMQPERFEGATPPLTAGRALDFDDVASLASAALGKPVTRTVISEADMAKKLEQRNMPPSAIGIVLGFYKAARDGEFAKVDPTLEMLVGKPPLTMRDIIEQAKTLVQ